MSSDTDNSDELTVDACPSYPEDNIEKPESNKETVNEESSNSSKENKHKTSHKIPTKRGKLKKNTPTAIASVINISNSNGIHIGSNYHVYVNKSDTNPQKNEKKIILTETIKSLFINTSPVTKEHIDLISTHLGVGWREVARALDYSDGQIDQFYESHISSGMKEVIYQFLLDWIQNEADTATVERLSNVLWKTNQKDVVQRWTELF